MCEILHLFYGLLENNGVDGREYNQIHINILIFECCAFHFDFKLFNFSLDHVYAVAGLSLGLTASTSIHAFLQPWIQQHMTTTDKQVTFLNLWINC